MEQEREDYISKLQEERATKATQDVKTAPDPSGKAPVVPEKPAKRTAKHKHVVVLVHLNRSFASSSASFSFDFERNWFAAFLDDIKPDTMLLRYIPKTTELLRGSEMELLQRIQLKHALRDSFRTCLARLIYPFQR